ncbi:MAG: hypothetical protein EAZ57_02810 [Cytophagales bacterium]|nr:MAG: hypothetical protein EAZ67_03275 [Cytophagales bacterium]TAF61691.1 MAG: hypothetical protein EAZ57_02810 [Cytophagales bacterium]
MCKPIFILFLILLVHNSHAQTELQRFLIGTWKVENKENYERWDKLNTNTLKGVSYELKNNALEIWEYLDLQFIKKKLVYSATVLSQNQGKKVDFELVKQENDCWVFENLKHDFPKRIVYQRLSDNELLVEISDGNTKKISYRLQK